MELTSRHISDKAFGLLAGFSAIVLVLVLGVILVPMILEGTGAVIFRGTVEFRAMQLNEFGHGDASKVQAEIAEVRPLRERLYDIIDTFKRGVDIDALQERAGQIHRQFGAELRYKDTPRERYTSLRSISRRIRDKLRAAFAGTDKEQMAQQIDSVLQYRGDARFEGTIATGYFELAAEFQESLQHIDLRRRRRYKEGLDEVEQIIRELFGPRPDGPPPALAMYRYGATRWDQAQKSLQRLLWTEKWVQLEQSRPLQKTLIERKKEFMGTQLEPLFGFVEENLAQMLRPKWTFYWRYFVDDSTPGHYFGGVGPEILGTIVLTVLSMVFVIPLGVISSAFLVEFASDNFVIRIIRMCINTLAGVPSIVFGLFGLAFFILFLIPAFGGPSKPCILAGAMTLAVLTLPVMIRASEEAIRTVPRAYKEGSLALGASRFWTFVAVTLPAALPGILTGVILSLSRVAGETAPILFTAGIAVGPSPKSVFDTTRTLSYGSWDMAVGDRLSAMVPHNQYGMVVTLVFLVLCLNGLAIVLRSRVFRKLKGQ